MCRWKRRSEVFGKNAPAQHISSDNVRYIVTALSVMYRLTLAAMIKSCFVGSDIELVDYLDYH